MNSEHVEVLERLRERCAALDAAIASLSAPQPAAPDISSGHCGDSSGHKQPAAVDGADAKDAEIHRLRAELEIEKSQAEFYRITRNWNQRKADRLEDALRLIKSAKDQGFGIDYARGVAQSALRGHDQEKQNDR